MYSIYVYYIYIVYIYTIHNICIVYSIVYKTRLCRSSRTMAKRKKSWPLAAEMGTEGMGAGMKNRSKRVWCSPSPQGPTHFQIGSVICSSFFRGD